LAGARPITVTLVLAALAWGLAAGEASAYVIGGRPWPGKQVTYYSTGSRSGKAIVDRGARVWNRARVGVRFRRSSSSRADVIVSGTAGGCHGSAYMGYPGERASWLYVAPCPTRLMVLVTAHEFGHVLGLDHEMRTCAIMNFGVDTHTGTPSRCLRRPLSYWMRHPLTRDDIRGARALANQARAAG
jgi:Matrixin